jgi:hypothetical protein
MFSGSKTTEQAVSRQSRRAFLGSVGVGITSLLAGCYAHGSDDEDRQSIDGSWAIDPDQYADRFDEVVDLVEHENVDPRGEEPINQRIWNAWDDDTLLVLPPGEYLMDGPVRRTQFDNVGLIGQNAIIRHADVDAIDGHRVTEGEYSGTTMMFRLGTSANPHGDLLFGGFVFDWSDENAGMQGLNAFVDGNLEVKNIQFHGIHSLGTHGNIRTATATPESYGLVENIDMRGGGLHYANTINERNTERYDGSTQEFDGRQIGQSWSTTGVTGHPDQQGTIHYDNIITGAWSGSPIYVRGGTGRKIVTNCVAGNSGGNQIRTNGGNDWEPVEYLDGTDDWQEARDGPYGQTTIENCQCIVETTPEGVHQVQRGILLQDGPQTVRNCDIQLNIAQGSGAGGSYGIGTRGDAGPIEIENCRIYLREPMDAIYISPHSGQIDVSGVEIVAEGWEATANQVLGGTQPSISDVTLNGEPI